MNVRQINLALQITAIVLGVAALAAVVIGLLVPLDTAPQIASSAEAAKATDSKSSLPSVDSFKPIFDRALQGSSSSAETAMNVAAPPADSGAAAAQLTLVGTIGNSVALIKGPDGTVGMVELGDDVDGAPVIAIRPGEVDLRASGKITTLRKAPTPDDTAIFVKQ